MAGLQRSAVSFRRQGSSGLVWDNKFSSGELIKEIAGDSSGASDGVLATLERSRSTGEGGGRLRYHRAMRDSPVAEPPSPRVSTCGFCGAFGKPPHGGRGKIPRKTKHGGN